MNVVSLFAGIEGIGLGFERQGGKVACQVEWDAAAARVLAHHFPDVPRFADVREVSVDDIRQHLTRGAFVLSAGFPCQDVSVAGRRAGVAEGTRSGLYREVVRLAEGLAPDWLVVENVPGLLSIDDGEGFAVVLGDLTGWQPDVPDGGWRNSGVCFGPWRSAAWRVLDAQHFGVAQRRRRVFIVCHSRDRAAPVAVLLEPEGLRGNPPPRGTSWSRTTGGVAGGADTVSTLQGGGRRGYRVDAEGAAGGHIIPTLARCLTAPERWDGETETFISVTGEITHALTSEGADASEDGTGRGTPLAFHVTQDPISGPVPPALGRESTAGVLTYAKRRRAGENDDSPESWAESDIAPTIDAAGHGPRTATAVVQPAGVDTYNAALDGDLAHTLPSSAGPHRMPHVLEVESPFVSRDVAPALTANYGKQPDNSDTNLGPSLVVESLAIRGREGGAQVESGGDLANALRTPAGGSSVQSARIGQAVRRLTPRECERLQGFPDDWTLIPGIQKYGELDILMPWENLVRLACPHSAEWTDALAALSIGRSALVSCTTRGTAGTALLISPPGLTGQAIPAPSAVVRADVTLLEDSAPGATSPGNGTVTQESPSGASRPDETMPRATSLTGNGNTTRSPGAAGVAPRKNCCTGKSLRLWPVENSGRTTSSITSTWTSKTTLPTTCGSLTEPATSLPMLPSIDSSLTSCAGESFALRVVSTTWASDSARYRQLGNAVCVNVSEWIAWRLVAYENGWRP